MKNVVYKNTLGTFFPPKLKIEIKSIKNNCAKKIVKKLNIVNSVNNVNRNSFAK